VQQIHQALLKALTAQLRKLEKVIVAKLENTPHFAQRAEIIWSVPGLADVATSGFAVGALRRRPAEPNRPVSGRGQGRSRRRRGRAAPALSPADHRAIPLQHSCSVAV
jgi:hypothetical protein